MRKPVKVEVLVPRLMSGQKKGDIILMDAPDFTEEAKKLNIDTFWIFGGYYRIVDWSDEQ